MKTATRWASCALACGIGAAAAANIEVYPSGRQVPENLMRIELRLDKSHHRLLDMRHVQLLDANGRPIAEPFLDLPLPSADGRRIALLLHPGRVKTGVGANRALGRALRAGESVTLVIDDPALGEPVRKAWQVGAFDNSRPSPESWTVTEPAAGTRQPLLVHLRSPISAASEGLIAVRGANGRRMAGRMALSDGETLWRFVPAKLWPAGQHWIVVHPDLEDPAGNRSCAAFEQAVERPAACMDEQELAFDVK